jgi:hypothetical protein
MLSQLNEESRENNQQLNANLDLTAKEYKEVAVRSEEKLHVLKTHCSALGALLADQYREAKLSQVNLDERTSQLDDARVKFAGFKRETDDLTAELKEKIIGMSR